MAGNRKERRAAAKNANINESKSKNTASGFEPTTEIDENGVEYLLRHPDRSGPKGKTLFELAEERQRELDKQNPHKRRQHSNQTSESAESIGPLGDGILYSITLAVLHLTLDVIVYSQYREEVVWSEILTRAGTALPIFFLLVYLLHVDFSRRFPTLRNMFFFVVSVVAGCYMVYSGNVNGYFFVMKTAPPIGALWVWSVVEMDLIYAATSCIVVVGFLWWNGFDAF